MLIFYYIIVYAFTFIFGACIGSFLNVCIYRLPLEESLTKSNSHCMTCGTPIKRRDLIPIISWCMLKGKCRACGAKISPRYTVVESLNAVGTLLIFLYYRVAYEPLRAVTASLLLAALIVVFFMDWDTQLISNYVVGFIAVLGVLQHIVCLIEPRWEYQNIAGENIMVYTDPSIVDRVIGMLCVSVPLLLIELLSKGRAMGRGDVYLMAAAGIFLGWKCTLIAFFIGLVTASIGGLILKYKNKSSIFAFGPFLSIGILTAALFGEKLIDLYLSSFPAGSLV